MDWNSLNNIDTRRFRCGHCDFIVATNKGYATGGGAPHRIYVCPNCDKPTYFDGDRKQIPGVLPGNHVEHVPPELQNLYREARASCSVSAFTASVLISRKMLMNIAVEQGAKPGESFLFYVDYLAANGFVPPNGKGWVDHIRKKGNEATHEIALMNQQDAGDLISFIEMLLKFIYEFPAKIPASP